MPTRILSRLCREPLLHFGLGGALIFLVYSMSSGPSPDTIVLGRETVDAIVRERCEESGRPLSESERSAAIDDLVHEEVLVREAYKEGIDRNDSVVRARLAEKMRFLMTVEPPAPSREQLESYFKSHQAHFAGSPHTSFEELLPVVRSQWVAAQRQESLRQRLDALRKQYRISMGAAP